jgi:hypothetical protein
MRRKILVLLAVLPVVALLAAVAPAAQAQETPPSLVASYDDLADAILAVRSMEANLVRAILAGHYHGAEAYFGRGDYAKAAAEMALFANEGDNAVGGVRKRLLEGGHHYNAEGEEQGVYEPGYVVVTREAKKAALDASAALRQADDDAARQAAWDAFAAVAGPLLGGEKPMMN